MKKINTQQLLESYNQLLFGLLASQQQRDRRCSFRILLYAAVCVCKSADRVYSLIRGGLPIYLLRI